jgi:hypothetical protein
MSNSNHLERRSKRSDSTNKATKIDGIGSFGGTDEDEDEDDRDEHGSSNERLQHNDTPGVVSGEDEIPQDPLTSKQDAMIDVIASRVAKRIDTYMGSISKTIAKEVALVLKEQNRVQDEGSSDDWPKKIKKKEKRGIGRKHMRELELYSRAKKLAKKKAKKKKSVSEKEKLKKQNVLLAERVSERRGVVYGFMRKMLCIDVKCGDVLRWSVIWSTVGVIFLFMLFLGYRIFVIFFPISQKKTVG